MSARLAGWRRLVLLLVAGAGPPVLAVAERRVPAAPLAALASIAAITAGLVVLEETLRRAGHGAVSVASTVLTLYGTALVWHEAVEPGLAASTFLAGALIVRGWPARAGQRPPAAIARGALLGVVLIAVALLTETATGARVTLAAGAPPLLDALFSSRHGALFWTPVLTLGVAGLVGRAARGRADAAGALAALTVMALVDASLRPWWTGGFANARLLPALPLLALGLAEGLEVVRATAVRRPLVLAAGAGAALVAWNLLLMAQYRAEMIPRDDTVSFPAVAENSAEIVQATVGAPVSWPASWLFAARHGLPAARYDLLGGQDVLAAGPSRFRLGDLETERALLGEGWSVRHPCGRAVCREVEGGRARVFLPVVDPGPAEVRVSAQGSGTLAVRLDGVEIGRGTLTEAFTEVGGEVPAERLRRGPNPLELEVSPGGRAAVESLRILPGPGAR
jgi:hypothetical protein